MKKVLATVAAASIVAAGAPAFAADVDLSGQVRVRYEQKNNFADLDDDSGDLSNDTSQRTRLSAKVGIDDQTTAKITLNDARTWGETGTTNDAADIVLNEGYLKIKNVIGPLTATAGRQALAYGNQRLIGSLEWADQSRRFDALKLTYGSEVVDLDIVASKTALNANASDDQINILYATVKNVVPANTLDAYLIQTVGGTGDRTNFNTLGLRLAGKAAGADWTAEMANQAGDSSTDGVDKKADAYAVTAGYTLDGVLGGLRIGVEAFSGSGQDTSADDTSFNNLYPTNHFHYGISDYSANLNNLNPGCVGDCGTAGTGWSNNTGTAIKLSAKPVDGLTVKLEYWAMETTEDIILDDNGTLGVPADDTYGAVEIVETNLSAKYGLTEKTSLYAYYSVVSVDIDGAPSLDDATKLGLQIAAKF